MPAVSFVEDEVASLQATADSVTVHTANGLRFVASKVVLAAGAWSTPIVGLPRPLPVTPLKGQMVAVAATPVSFPVMSDHVYLVPRQNETVIGATAERAGFDTSVTTDAINELRRSAAMLCPSLEHAPTTRAWAGLRPATPDMLPIIGPDPDQTALLYACGHSRNGILLAPQTAVTIARLAQDEQPQIAIDSFSIERFS